MEMLLMAMPVAAAGYSLVYLLAGGGLGGAILIFIVAKTARSLDTRLTCECCGLVEFVVERSHSAVLAGSCCA